jgi:hypothetical protein
MGSPEGALPAPARLPAEKGSEITLLHPAIR